MMGAPAEMVPQFPAYTSLLSAVRGHSMEPLIHDGDIAAVDLLANRIRADLDGKSRDRNQ